MEIKMVIYLVRIFCIHYMLQFLKKKVAIRALINFSNEFNVIILGYVKELDLWHGKTNIRAEKIDG